MAPQHRARIALHVSVGSEHGTSRREPVLTWRCCLPTHRTRSATSHDITRSADGHLRANRCRRLPGSTVCASVRSQHDYWTTQHGRRSMSEWRLWYREPASLWMQAVPIGNGRLGAMVFGGVDSERIQLNESSLWSGGPQATDNPDALSHLAEVRNAYFAGQYRRAHQLADSRLMSVGGGFEAAYGASYQVLADLWIDTLNPTGSVHEYRRDLDIGTGVASTEIAAGRTRLIRECFASMADDVIVVRLEPDNPGSISVRLRLTRPADATVRAAAPNCLHLSGQCDGGTGMRFAAQVVAICSGGRHWADGDSICIEAADGVTILIAGTTDYREPIPDGRCRRTIEACRTQPYESLRSRSAEAHQKLFDRVDIDLGRSAASDLPTPDRLKHVRAGGDDPHLLALYFQYGRYLLMASSMPGAMPANLQGLWCEELKPAWHSDYHLNINVQMNYWHAEVANLAECHLPLFDLIESLVEPGSKTARVHYDCPGWVAHTITNVWGFTSPGWSAGWGMWPTGGAWLCQHLWEHFAFGRDLDFLRRAYPTMRSCAEFFLHFLVEDPRTGGLVCGPSVSPENAYRSADGQTANVCMGPSMDQQLIWDLFTNCIEAADALGEDGEFRNRLIDARARLAGPRIGKHGQLQEWLEDFDEPEPGHRHISHAFALHPGRQITLRDTPELALAVRRTLERRLEHGGGHTGWSRAWFISFWARLEEPELAHENAVALLQD
ncbi:glycoside hydrolase family 95 protein, partial [Candidatus Poribacteria bacterium]|nr:glycoside hydrolase family 95 protein [Candidatus Poribacteria bacterium]